MSYQPDVVIANGNHIYWDLKTLLNKPFAKYVQEEMWSKFGGAWDVSVPMLHPKNAAIFLGVCDYQIPGLYGITAPAGAEANRIATERGGRCCVVSRFDGPEKAVFDKTWQSPAIETSHGRRRTHNSEPGEDSMRMRMSLTAAALLAAALLFGGLAHPGLAQEKPKVVTPPPSKQVASHFGGTRNPMIVS